MPNIYATPTEIKAALPDGIRDTTTKYDDLLFRLANTISRYIDRHCRGRKFFPELETRHFDGSGDGVQWIDDLVSIGTIAFSADNGQSYTDFVAADFILAKAEDYNDPRSYNTILINRGTSQSQRSTFPRGQRTIRITDGIWGFSDFRDEAFEDSGDSVQDAAGINASVTTITVADVDGADKWGVEPRFERGKILQIEDEFLEIVSTNITNDTMVVVRGVNGTTAASHAKDTQIDIWRSPDPVKQAAIIQAVRQYERGFQAFGDAQGNVETGRMFFLKRIDPEAAELLDNYRLKFY